MNDKTLTANQNRHNFKELQYLNHKSTKLQRAYNKHQWKQL